MDPLHQYDDLPWELIESALQDRLSPGEELQFSEWLAASADNQQTYVRLQKLWREGLSDYRIWQEADGAKAWESVRQRIGGQKSIRRTIQMAAAAIVLLTIGFTWWYRAEGDHPLTYETAVNEQRKIALPDGSTVVIDQNTLLRIAADYNKKGGRTVLLASGQASFEVSHQAQIPFRVDMDVVSVTDIGTSFTVHRTKEKIEVSVASGKVAFMIKETGESREISAGGSLVYNVPEKRWGGSERYIDSPLEEVIAALERSSGKKISLADGISGQKKLTIDLSGGSVENSLKIICATLDLEYIEDNGGFVLKQKGTR